MGHGPAPPARTASPPSRGSRPQPHRACENTFWFPKVFLACDYSPLSFTIFLVPTRIFRIFPCEYSKYSTHPLGLQVSLHCLRELQGLLLTPHPRVALRPQPAGRAGRRAGGRAGGRVCRWDWDEKHVAGPLLREREGQRAAAGFGVRRATRTHALCAARGDGRPYGAGLGAAGHAGAEALACLVGAAPISTPPHPPARPHPPTLAYQYNTGSRYTRVHVQGTHVQAPARPHPALPRPGHQPYLLPAVLAGLGHAAQSWPNLLPLGPPLSHQRPQLLVVLLREPALRAVDSMRSAHSAHSAGNASALHVAALGAVALCSGALYLGAALGADWATGRERARCPLLLAVLRLLWRIAARVPCSGMLCKHKLARVPGRSPRAW